MLPFAVISVRSGEQEISGATRSNKPFWILLMPHLTARLAIGTLIPAGHFPGGIPPGGGPLEALAESGAGLRARRPHRARLLHRGLPPGQWPGREGDFPPVPAPEAALDGATLAYLIVLEGEGDTGPYCQAPAPTLRMADAAHRDLLTAPDPRVHHRQARQPPGHPTGGSNEATIVDRRKATRGFV
jgi:hypothetical protein